MPWPRGTVITQNAAYHTYLSPGIPQARYIVRGLQGNLRIGLAGAGVLAALGQAVALTPPGENIIDTSKTLGKSKVGHQ